MTWTNRIAAATSASSLKVCRYCGKRLLFANRSIRRQPSPPGAIILPAPGGDLETMAAPPLPIPGVILEPVDAAAGPPRAATARRFRLQGKKFFVTFPQCDTPKEQALANIVEHYGDVLKWAVVGAEKHEDGNPHLHACFELGRKYTYCIATCFDFVAGAHGNYQTCRNVRNCLKYCSKDGDFVSKGIDVGEILSKKDGKHTVIAGMVRGGATLTEVDNFDPGFVLQNKRKLEEYIAWHSVKRQRRDKRDWPTAWNASVYDVADTHAMGVLLDWIRSNVKVDRHHRQKQLFICGPTGIGKTTLLLQLREYLSVFMVNMAEDSYAGYEDGIYDLVVFDEFKSQKTIQFMNSFCDGSPVWLKSKLAPALLKNDNLPVIVCSNFTPEECYPHADAARPAFKDRFVFANFTRSFRIEPMYAALEELGSPLLTEEEFRLAVGDSEDTPQSGTGGQPCDDEVSSRYASEDEELPFVWYSSPATPPTQEVIDLCGEMHLRNRRNSLDLPPMERSNAVIKLSLLSDDECSDGESLCGSEVDYGW